MRASVVAARRPGSKGCAPGTVHSGSGQPQRERPCGSAATPGSTGHCHSVAKVRAALINSGLPSLRWDRSLRRLPRISRMSARSFPLHRWQHRGGHITSCVDHFTVRTCWRITPLPEARGTPMGRTLTASAAASSMLHPSKAWAWRGGGEVWRFAVPRISLRLRHGRMGRGRRWLRRPGRSPGSGWLSTTPGLLRVRTHHDRCDALWSKASRPQYPVTRVSFKPTLLFGKGTTGSPWTPGIPAGQCWTSPHECVYMWRHC